MNTRPGVLPWVAAGTIVMIPLLVPAAAQAAEEMTHTAAGVSSEVTIFNEDDVDRSRSVGLVVYLDGDGQRHATRPDGSTITRMARAAAEQNMILAVPVSPDKATDTWWENAEVNGRWVQSLVEELIDQEQVDDQRVHFIGFSGGAQILGDEVLADGLDSLIAGGGATIIGGGGSGGRLEDPPSAQLAANLSLTWYTNASDVAWATDAGRWSALADARRGAQAYQAAGVQDAQLVTLDGPGHSYDLAQLAAQDLQRLYSEIPGASTQQDEDRQDRNSDGVVENQQPEGQGQREDRAEQGNRSPAGDIERRAGQEQPVSLLPTPVEPDSAQRSLWESLRDLVQRTDPGADQREPVDRVPADDVNGDARNRDQPPQGPGGDVDGRAPGDRSAATGQPREPEDGSLPGGVDGRETSRDRDIDEHRQGQEQAPSGDRSAAAEDPTRDHDRRDDGAVEDRQGRQQRDVEPAPRQDRDEALERDQHLVVDPVPDRAPGAGAEQDPSPTGTQGPSEETVSVWKALRDLLRQVGID